METKQVLQVISEVIKHYSLCGSRSLQSPDSVVENDISDTELDKVEKAIYRLADLEEKSGKSSAKGETKQ